MDHSQRVHELALGLANLTNQKPLSVNSPSWIDDVSEYLVSYLIAKTLIDRDFNILQRKAEKYHAASEEVQEIG